MQAAWIIWAHLVKAWSFETCSVSGLRRAGGSKNAISQVVAHELKITEHDFLGRLHCRSCPPQYSVTEGCLFFHPDGEFQGKISLVFSPDDLTRQQIWRKQPDDWSGYSSHHPFPHDTTITSGVFTMFYHPLYGVYVWDVWIRWRVGKMQQRHFSPSHVIELSRSWDAARLLQ